MKHLTILLGLALAISFNVKAQEAIHLDAKTFKEKVWDYTKNKEWKYKGSTPAIVDFYADWCRPCRNVAPILEELAKEYGSKIKIYKVNVDKNREISRIFKITSLPTFFYIKASGEISKEIGGRSKSQFEKDINDYLGVTK